MASAAAGLLSGERSAGITSAEIKGDINGDVQVDILDVQLCVNVVLGTEKDTAIVQRADVNQDGAVNVLDVQGTVNIFLAPPATPTATITATPTHAGSSTSTPTAAATITPAPPTSSASYTPIPSSTHTSSPTPSATPVPPTATSMPSNTATEVPEPSVTASLTPQPHDTPSPSPTADGSPPYPLSLAITNLTWAPASTIVREATGSDNWPLTWADNDSLYTAYGDGYGFDPKVTDKLSLGFARVDGPATAYAGTNIYPSDGQQTGNGSSGKKASGMLMVDGVLYMWVRNANSCQLAWSTDFALSWTWADWTFTELGYCAFLNFGRNYQGARDAYVYMFSPDSPSAYSETDTASLVRTPSDQISDRSAYEFFKELDAVGNPVWATGSSDRGAVFEFTGGVNRLDVTYNAPAGRYLMTMRSLGRNGGLNQFSIYDAPEPWGPWTTVFYTESWDVDPGESQHIPSKWISSDGKTIYLVFSGGDSFSVRKANLDFQD